MQYGLEKILLVIIKFARKILRKAQFPCKLAESERSLLLILFRPTVRQLSAIIIFYKTIYNEIIIRFGFCDMPL